MTVIYPAIFHQEDNAFRVEFPDLQGCRSVGETLEEALANAREALAGCCALLLEQHKKLPAATPVQAVTTPEKSFVTLVDTKPASEQKAVKKNLSIPAWLNALAEEAHAPYSKLLQNALEAYLGLDKPSYSGTAG